MQHISITVVKEVFSQYGFGEGCSDVIGCNEVHDLLTDLYTRIDPVAAMQADEAEIHAELLQNVILNLFDT